MQQTGGNISRTIFQGIKREGASALIYTDLLSYKTNHDASAPTLFSDRVRVKIPQLYGRAQEGDRGVAAVVKVQILSLPPMRSVGYADGTSGRVCNRLLCKFETYRHVTRFFGRRPLNNQRITRVQLACKFDASLMQV
jgi:hypothetical protein